MIKQCELQAEKPSSVIEDRQEAALDEALEETFPSSDPIAISVITRAILPKDNTVESNDLYAAPLPKVPG